MKNENMIVEEGEFELWEEMRDYSSAELIKYIREIGSQGDWIEGVAIEEFFRRISLGMIKPTDLKPKLTSQYKRFDENATPIEGYYKPNWTKFYQTGILEKAPDWQQEMNERFDYFYKDYSIEYLENMLKKMKSEGSLWSAREIDPTIELIKRRKKLTD